MRRPHSAWASSASTLYLSAVEQLKALAEREGLDAAERAAAECFAPLRRQMLIAGGRVLQRSVRLKKRVARELGYEWDLRPWCLKNLSIWYDGAKDDIVVHGQPYDLKLTDLSDIQAIAERSGATVGVNGSGSYRFPGRTFLVSFSLPSRRLSGLE